MSPVKKIARSVIAVDGVLILFMFVSAANTDIKEGQQGMAMVFTILTAAIAAVGCGVFAWGNRRESSFLMGLAVVILGIPLILGFIVVFSELFNH